MAGELDTARLVRRSWPSEPGAGYARPRVESERVVRGRLVSPRSSTAAAAGATGAVVDAVWTFLDASEFPARPGDLLVLDGEREFEVVAVHRRRALLRAPKESLR